MGFDLGGLADMAKNALGGSFAEKAGDFLKSHGMEYLQRLVNPPYHEECILEATPASMLLKPSHNHPQTPHSRNHRPKE